MIESTTKLTRLRNPNGRTIDCSKELNGINPLAGKSAMVVMIDLISGGISSRDTRSNVVLKSDSIFYYSTYG